MTNTQDCSYQKPGKITYPYKTSNRNVSYRPLLYALGYAIVKSLGIKQTEKTKVSACDGERNPEYEMT